MVLAAICNGASVYLKRTGLADEEAYHAYWAVHCGVGDVAVREWQCARLTTPAAIARVQAAVPVQTLEFRAASFRYVYEVSSAERQLKLAKELLWLALIAVCVWMIGSGRVAVPSSRRPWPLTSLLLYVVLAAAFSVAWYGAFVAGAGLRSFMFLLLALSGVGLVRHMGVFARATAVLLVLQLLLAPFELYRGIHLFREWSPLSLAGRLVATMVQPNSLGVFAVVGFAFCYSFWPSLSRSRMAALGCVALALVFLSGSGTGLICAALALLFVLRQRLPGAWPVLGWGAGLVVLALVVFGLPVLTGRPQVFDSIGTAGGRLTMLHAALFERSGWSVLLGDGLGVNTNAALSLVGQGASNAASVLAQAPTDSALTGLLIQLGVLGTLLFYGSLLWAARRDAPARPFYAIVLVCTLTINITELFPVNLLLGLALAHSIWSGRHNAATPRIRHG